MPKPSLAQSLFGLPSRSYSSTGSFFSDGESVTSFKSFEDDASYASGRRRRRGSRAPSIADSEASYGRRDDASSIASFDKPRSRRRHDAWSDTSSNWSQSTLGPPLLNPQFSNKPSRKYVKDSDSVRAAPLSEEPVPTQSYSNGKRSRRSADNARRSRVDYDATAQEQQPVLSRQSSTSSKRSNTTSAPSLPDPSDARTQTYPPTSKRSPKKSRKVKSAEDLVDALSRAGILERVMEVVQEVEEVSDSPTPVAKEHRLVKKPSKLSQKQKPEPSPVAAPTPAPASKPSTWVRKTGIIAAGFRPLPSSDNPISLESLSFEQSFESLKLVGTILVAPSYQPTSVFVRLTSNKWATHTEVAANLQSELSSSGLPRYSFESILDPQSKQTEFAIRAMSDDGEKWDSNNGSNYVVPLPEDLSLPAIQIPASVPQSLVNEPTSQALKRSSTDSQGPSPASTVISERSYRTETDISTIDTPLTPPNLLPSEDEALAHKQLSVLIPQTPPKLKLTRTESDYAVQKASGLKTPEVEKPQFPPTPAADEQTVFIDSPDSLGSPTDRPSPPPLTPRNPNRPRTVSGSSQKNSAMPKSAVWLGGEAQPVIKVRKSPSLDKNLALPAHPSRTPSPSPTSPSSALPLAHHPIRPASMAPLPSDSTSPQSYPSNLPRAVVELRNSMDARPSTLSHRTSSASGRSQSDAPFAWRRSRVSSDAGPSDYPSPEEDSQQNRRGLATSESALPFPRHRLLSDNSSSFDGQTSMYSTQSTPLTTLAVPKAISTVSHGTITSFHSNELNFSQATMYSISVAANAITKIKHNPLVTAWRALNQRPDADYVPPHLVEELAPPTRVTFGNLTQMPKRLKNDELLVEVFAAAVDFWDRSKVSVLASRGEGFGFVPGRSFCGRVVEIGQAVTKFRKGEFVYGLNDLRRCGALAQYVVTNKDSVALAPDGKLSIEQLAALPLAGIQAYQAMDSLCADLPIGSKLLILDAHNGVGSIAIQLALAMRQKKDLWITAQIPAGSSTDVIDFVKAIGANEVVVNDPIAAVNSLHESSFDGVLDTLGGRRVYDASRRILHDGGFFVTTVGDVLDAMHPQTWKNTVRSLRRAFFKKDKKYIGYWFPAQTDPQLTRDTLDSIRQIVEAGQLRPTVRRVLPFQDGAVAFHNNDEGIVVRIAEP